eukprot:gnl/Hemi2/25697_TR8634_c0_g1_i2.p1 gnl/Hemi2/25697_TR8634_c0_g1~~gnl/Hemi2/25697_TR8634_c0_g1_i2.p1  ORF type:complete len:191 (-),score=21.14 gnl/Hemi2/25697_TR8634_c0_g1_i2:54-626(-)
MSGIATKTHAFVQAVAGTKCQILDTRKTAPGMRYLDKLAVKLGGGVNHRVGLFDMVLIKDNHVTAAGGVVRAIESAKEYVNEHNMQIRIECEARTLEEVQQAMSVPGVDVLMLDNMVKTSTTESGSVAVDVSMLKEALAIVAGRCKTEASGNMSLDTVGPVAATGVDCISVGALTHSVTALDISLKIHLQ